MSTVLRFEDDKTKAINKERVKQQRVVPVGTLLYADSINLPEVLSKNTLLFTTDTRELYIGTGTGIARVNIGSDGDVIDKGDYLSKVEAAQIYVQKEYLDPSTVVTDQEMSDFVAPLAKTVDDLIKEVDFKADKENTYTKGESNERFIDNEEFATGMSKKVDQEILTNTGNHAFVKNLSTGVMLKFQNLGNDVESYANIGKDMIVLYSKRTKGEKFGGHVYVTPAGVFYTHGNDEAYGKNDELVTMSDLNAVQEMYNQVQNMCNETKQIAMRSAESARNSELMVETTKSYIDNAVLQSKEAFDLATEANYTVNRVNGQLTDAYSYASSSLQKATNASNTAAAAKAESGETLTRLKQFETSISGQFQRLVEQINLLSSGGVISDDGRKVVVSVQEFDDIYEVPYHTEAANLKLPTQVMVTLNDGTTRTVPVTWQLSRFQNHQTGYSQQIIGIITENGEIKNPNFLFALYTVRVLPASEESDDTTGLNWEVTFAMPTWTSSVNNFSKTIGHPELTSEDIMGTYDALNDYVAPSVKLFFVGTLKGINTSMSDILVLDAIDKANNVNYTLATVSPDGLQVPIYGVATPSQVADYETQVKTNGLTNCNGAVSYIKQYDTLQFNNSIDANAVYTIRKTSSSNNNS